MEQYIPVLKRTQLFAGVGEEEIASMLSCLDARICTCAKGEYVLHQGAHLDSILLLVKGRLHIQKDDYWGNRSILAQIEVGEMFGEAYAAPDSGALVNDVVAVEESAVLLFDVKRLITTCSSACRFHSVVVRNMFFAVCGKNKKLVDKLSHMSKRSTREKLMSYLSEEAKRQNSASFAIPFDRQQLADFLSVDRSAMSNELSKLRRDGLLQFEKNRFTLL
ncbi:MAG: Crp/Fnr family transcriptional regulator [Oscillospiraceae bacterium]|nr:Crp/Fnr family transcriptional regulator [Oscillospiraceae bacterium]